MEKITDALNRRTFLGLGAAGVAGALYLGAAGGGALVPCEKDNPYYAALEPFIRLGRVSLRESPERARTLPAAHLAFLRGAKPDHFAMKAEFEALAGDIDRARQADFENGRMVSCDGWMIAESEARLCSMIAVASSMHDGDKIFA